MLFSILLLGLLSIGLGASSPNYDVPRNTSQKRDLTDKKTFYVDVSIHGDFDDPYIYYFNGYSNNASLSKLDNDLYTFDVPSNVFSDA